MDVKALIFITLFLINFATSTGEIDSMVVYEKIDRAGKIQDGGAQDLEKVLTKSILDEMDEFENDKFFNS